MDCENAAPFVSTLHDGEIIPGAAAHHIASCPDCQQQMRDYTQMAAELRLLASMQREEELPMEIPGLSRTRERWLRVVMGRVPVPRFAVALSVLVILGLAVGLQLVRAQSRGPWFEYEVRVEEPGGANSGAHWLEGPGSGRLGGGPLSVDRTSDADGKNKTENGYILYTHEIRNDAVHMGIRVYSAQGWLDEIGRTSAIQNAPEREFWYKPGETLRIPIEGMGELALKGKVSDERPVLRGSEPPTELKPDEIAFRSPELALVRNKQLLFQFEKGTKVGFTNCQSSPGGTLPYGRSAASLYFPGVGVFVLALQPFEGAVEGHILGGQVAFTLHGDEYRLFSAAPIIVGLQPRSVWVYYDPRYLPSRINPDFAAPSDDARLVISCGDVAHLFQSLRGQ